MATKLATCCYCGKRAALVLAGRKRHELACSGCGAPLHEMKMLKVEPRDEAPRPGRASRQGPGLRAGRSRPQKRRIKRRKPLLNRILGELEDVLDDLFD